MNENSRIPRDEIQDLLVQAGPPPDLPAEDLAAIRAAARAEWQALAPRTGVGFDTRPLLALAASLLLVAALAWWWTRTPAPGVAETVATVELVRDDASITNGDAGSARGAAAGDELPSRSTLVTTTGPIAVRLAGGQSVRLAAASEMRIASASRLELLRGAVYVDSGPGSRSENGIEVATPLGLVTEIGTQFEVRTNGTVRVRVREGAVSLSHAGDSYSAAVGQQLTIDDNGEVFRAAVPLRGAEWDWAVEAAPPIVVEGLPIAAYLEWVIRETGLELQWADAGLERVAREEIVLGTIESLTPRQSLESVLRASGLSYEIREGTLLIGGPAGGE